MEAGGGLQASSSDRLRGRHSSASCLERGFSTSGILDQRDQRGDPRIELCFDDDRCVFSEFFKTCMYHDRTKF